MKIICEGVIIGESDDVVVLGREYYFPLDAVNMEVLAESGEPLYCPDKGYGANYDIVAASGLVRGGAWVYPHPYPSALALKGRIGFKETLVSE